MVRAIFQAVDQDDCFSPWQVVKSIKNHEIPPADKRHRAGHAL